MDCFVAEPVIGPAEWPDRWLLAKTGGNNASEPENALPMKDRKEIAQALAA